MKIYKPILIRPLRLMAMALRGLAALLSEWPLLLFAAVVVSPVGPHVLIDAPDQRHTHPQAQVICTYIGFRGRAEMLYRGGCPLVTLVDCEGE